MSLEHTVKSDELLQAQLATYAAEALDRDSGEHLINGIGSVALHEQSPVTLMVDEDRIVPDGDTGFFKVGHVREEKTLATPSDYLRFLREKGGSNYEPIHARAELLKNYQEFKSSVDVIKEEFKAHDLHINHPNHLGRGSNAAGTLLEKDGQQYVMRSEVARPLEKVHVDHYADRLIRGRGLPHFEQISAISYEDGVVISERMAGRQLSELTPIELNQCVTDQQLDEMVQSLRLGQERGIELDPNTGNTFYDERKGFGFIDYNKVPKDAQQGHLARHIDYGSALILASGAPEGQITEQDFADTLPYIVAEVALTERYEAACQRMLDEQDYAEAIPAVVERRNRLIKQYDAFSDPAQVAQRIADDQRLLKQRADLSRVTETGEFVSVISDVL